MANIFSRSSSTGRGRTHLGASVVTDVVPAPAPHPSLMDIVCNFRSVTCLRPPMQQPKEKEQDPRNLSPLPADGRAWSCDPQNRAWLEKHTVVTCLDAVVPNPELMIKGAPFLLHTLTSGLGRGFRPSIENWLVSTCNQVRAAFPRVSSSNASSEPPLQKTAAAACLDRRRSERLRTNVAPGGSSPCAKKLHCVTAEFELRIDITSSKSVFSPSITHPNANQVFYSLIALHKTWLREVNAEADLLEAGLPGLTSRPEGPATRSVGGRGVHMEVHTLFDVRRDLAGGQKSQTVRSRVIDYDQVREETTKCKIHKVDTALAAPGCGPTLRLAIATEDTLRSFGLPDDRDASDPTAAFALAEGTTGVAAANSYAQSSSEAWALVDTEVENHKDSHTYQALAGATGSVTTASASALSGNSTMRARAPQLPHDQGHRQYHSPAPEAPVAKTRISLSRQVLPGVVMTFCVDQIPRSSDGEPSLHCEIEYSIDMTCTECIWAISDPSNRRRLCELFLLATKQLLVWTHGTFPLTQVPTRGSCLPENRRR
jgi:hypothetical protein